MSKEVTAPIQKSRLAAYKEMTPATKELAKEIEEKIGKGAMALVIMQYNIGSKIAEVTKPENEEEYGSKAVTQLAAYLNLEQGSTYLYNLRNFAQKFDKNFVQEWSGKPMSSGKFLSLHHWLQVMKLQEEKHILKALNATLANSWTASDLEKEIRSGAQGKQTSSRGGGRNPKMPTSAVAGLQKTFTLLQKFNRFEEAAEETIYGAIEEMEPDKVSDALLERLDEVAEQAETTVEKAKEVISRCAKAKKRVEKVLASKPKEEAEPKKKPKSSAKASSNGKHEGNGHSAPKKVKKGLKKKKAAAVVEA